MYADTVKKNKKDKKYMLFKLFPNWFFAEFF